MSFLCFSCWANSAGVGAYDGLFLGEKVRGTNGHYLVYLDVFMRVGWSFRSCSFRRLNLIHDIPSILGYEAKIMMFII
jgi:hypothetical protein